MLTLTGAALDQEELDHALHMRHALALAARVLTATPNPRVGCVIVGADNEVVGEGWHAAPGQPHAEIIALRQAGERARGSHVFVTLEPCAHHGRTPPCTDALIAAGVASVIVAVRDPFPAVAGRGIRRLEEAGVRVIHLSDYEAAARAINAGFFQRHERGRPFVRCKLAMSLDGRTAAPDGSSRWITGPHARRDVQRLRASSCAIVTGSGTVLADDPALTVRPDELALTDAEARDNAHALGRQPLRVVLDGRGRVPPAAQVFTGPGVALWWLGGVSAPATLPAAVVVERAPAVATGVALAPVLESLAARYQVNEVLLEAGPQLCGAFMQAGLVDELVVYVGARLLGQRGLPLLLLDGIESMKDTRPLKFIDATMIGDDCRLVARPGNP